MNRGALHGKSVAQCDSMGAMSTHRSPAGGRGAFTARGMPGGNARVLLVAAGVVVVALVVAGVMRGQRAAEWAPIDVVDSRDPLQELPIRVADEEGVVRPAATYDAVLDLSSIDELVLGVDLDFVPRGAGAYQAVLRDAEDREHFRGVIDGAYFDEGRFMLRLFSRRFDAADYRLEIEADDARGDMRVVAASWFQILK